MKTIQLEVNIYQWEELSTEAQKRAICDQFEFLLDIGSNDDITLDIVIDNIKANEYWFFENGDIAPTIKYTGNHPQSGTTVFKQDGKEIIIEKEERERGITITSERLQTSTTPQPKRSKKFQILSGLKERFGEGRFMYKDIVIQALLTNGLISSPDQWNPKIHRGYYADAIGAYKGNDYLYKYSKKCPLRLNKIRKGEYSVFEL